MLFLRAAWGQQSTSARDPYPRQLHSCRRKAPYLARTTTGRLTRVAARLAFMETMVQSGGIRVSICITLGAIDCAIPVRLAERFSRVPTRCTSTSSVRSSSTNHHPGRGEAFPRQPLLPSTTVDPDSFTSVRLDGCQGGEVHLSVPRVPPPRRRSFPSAPLFPWKVLRAGLAMARFMVHAVAAMAMCVRARVESVSLVRRGAMKHDAARS